MRRTFHNFDSDIISILEVFGQPNCGEVSPSKFLHKDITIAEHLTNMTRVIPTNFIILNAFVFTVIFFIEVKD